MFTVVLLKVCRFNPVPGRRDGLCVCVGGGGIYLPPPPNFCLKIRTVIDFSRNFLAFNFYGQLKHDIRSLRYVSRCFVKGR